MRGLSSKTGIRLELWIGAYALIATVAIVLPALVFVEQRLESSLIAHELDLVAREEHLMVESLSDRVNASEASLGRLARRISALPTGATTEELAEFERLVRLDRDGAHRSRVELFQPAVEAGIWVPRTARLDGDGRAFYVRAKHVLDDVAGTMDASLTENAWVLVDHGGEVILWPDAPNFIYGAEPDHDYSDTEWVGLARPARNPEGRPRWTRVEFDPVPRIWMVSVVAPFPQAGRFAGSVGHDVPLERLVRLGDGGSSRSRAIFMVIDEEGRFLASTRHAAAIRRGRGAFAVDDLRDAALRGAIHHLRRLPRPTGGRRDEVQRMDAGAHVVLGTRIAATNWTVITALPRQSVTDRLAGPLRTLRTATLMALGLVLAASVLTIDQDRRRRLAAAAQLRSSEEKLARAQKLEALGRFAGGIAHDFNNILTVISGFAEVAMRRGPQDSKLREHLEQIVRSCERASDLTKQLLAFAKSQPVVAQVVDVNRLVRDTHKLLRRVIGEDIELVTWPSSDDANVVGDPGQLEQVLTNLAINARDAMPEGGTLELRVELLVDRVVLSVADTGSGMSPETLARATEPFFSTKPAGRGTGLGLATCQTIIEHMGGRMDIRSTVGVGTTFTIVLPRTSARAIESSPPRDTSRSHRAHGEFVLLVEDDAQVRSVIVQLLSAQGFQVLEAENGAEGLAVVRARFDELACIVTDVIMPVLGGGPFMASVRREHPHIPVVVTSGYVDDPRVRDDLRELDVDFLPKPFTAVQLIDVVFAAIARHKVGVGRANVS